LFLTAPSLLSFQHFLFLLWHDSCTYQQFSCMFFAIRGVVLLIPFIYNTVAGGVTEVRNRWKPKQCDNFGLPILPTHNSHQIFLL
jgi:hypothetical protein